MLGKSLTLAALAGVLAGGLTAVPAQAGTSGKAAHQHHGGSPDSAHSLLRAAPPPPTAQQAMLMAREHWLSEHAGVRELAALGDAVAAVGRANGALTGIVRGLGGRPVAGACVTATGPSGMVLARSRANGRYILPGLRRDGREAASEHARQRGDHQGSAGHDGTFRAEPPVLWTNLPPNSVRAFLYQRVAKPLAPQAAVNLILSC